MCVAEEDISVRGACGAYIIDCCGSSDRCGGSLANDAEIAIGDDVQLLKKNPKIEPHTTESAVLVKTEDISFGGRREAEIIDCASSDQSDARPDIVSVSPNFLGGILGDVQNYNMISIRSIVDDAAANLKRHVAAFGCWSSLSQHQVRVFEVLYYLQTERIVQPEDDVFGVNVLLLTTGARIRSHRSGVYFYTNGSFVRKKSLPHSALNLAKKVLSSCISFADSNAVISAQTLRNRRHDINDQNAEHCHATGVTCV